MATYETVYDFYACSEDHVTRIEKIDAIITALEDASLKLAANADVEEYLLDDGQTRIRTTYRDPNKLAKVINAFEGIRNKLINRNCLGRTFTLRDKDSFFANK